MHDSNAKPPDNSVKPVYVPSPCLGICTLVDEVCTGCKRTIREIRLWRKFTNEEKLEVIERITPLQDQNKNVKDY